MIRRIFGSHKRPNRVVEWLYINKRTAPTERKMREVLVFIVSINFLEFGNWER